MDRDAGEPFYTFKQIHDDFYKRLTTDNRLTSEYRIDTWSKGRFNAEHLPPTGIHGRYQPIRVTPIEESTCFYTYRIEAIVWLLISQSDVDNQYDLATYYMSRVMEIFTDKPNDWSLDGVVNDVQFVDAAWAQDWSERNKSVLLCSTTFAIIADIERLHTQSN